MNEKTVKKILEKEGKKAYEVAKDAILNERIFYVPLRYALKYFICEVWHNFQHPALLSLSCKAVGGDPNSTTLIAASMVLLTGAADIHDDIIDQSKTKNGKPTVYGKFGKDLSLMVGDALIIKGYTLLSEAFENFSQEKRKMMLNLVKEAFFEMGNAAAEEISLKGKFDIDPEKYFTILKKKSAIAEAAARIGGIIGNGSTEEIEALGKYGRVLGVLVNTRHEFIDIFECEELKNRLKNECLPLPLLYALKSKTFRENILPKLRRKRLARKDLFEIAQAVMRTEHVQNLRALLNQLLDEAIVTLKIIKNPEVVRTLSTLLYATIEGL
jgi:geranylgeranyl pyrophosphate synthase